MLFESVCCGDVMDHNFLRLRPGSTLAEAAALLQAETCAAVPVVDEATGAALGIVRREALLRAFSQGDLPGDEVTPLIEAAPAMASVKDVFSEEACARDMLLVEEEGRLAGVLRPVHRDEHRQFARRVDPGGSGLFLRQTVENGDAAMLPA